MDFKKIGMTYLKALIISAAASGIMILLMAFILYKAELTGLAVNIMTVTVYLVATFLGGLLSGKRMEKRRFLWGALFGLLYFLVLLGVRTFYGGAEVIGVGGQVRTLILCVLGGTLGGMIS